MDKAEPLTPEERRRLELWLQAWEERTPKEKKRLRERFKISPKTLGFRFTR